MNTTGFSKARHSKIGNLETSRVVQQNIGRLEIAMHDILLSYDDENTAVNNSRLNYLVEVENAAHKLVHVVLDLGYGEAHVWSVQKTRQIMFHVRKHHVDLSQILIRLCYKTVNRRDYSGLGLTLFHDETSEGNNILVEDASQTGNLSQRRHRKLPTFSKDKRERIVKRRVPRKRIVKIRVPYIRESKKNIREFEDIIKEYITSTRIPL